MTRNPMKNVKTLQQNRAACRNPKAFPDGSRFAVVNVDTGEPVEGHASERKASDAALALDMHEDRAHAAGYRPNGPARYIVQDINRE